MSSPRTAQTPSRRVLAARLRRTPYPPSGQRTVHSTLTGTWVIGVRDYGVSCTARGTRSNGGFVPEKKRESTRMGVRRARRARCCSSHSQGLGPPCIHCMRARGVLRPTHTLACMPRPSAEFHCRHTVPGPPLRSPHFARVHCRGPVRWGRGLDDAQDTGGVGRNQRPGVGQSRGGGNGNAVNSHTRPVLRATAMILKHVIQNRIQTNENNIYNET